MKKEDIRFFDRTSDFSVMERALPHWSQAGTLCFITWRLADSLPRDVLECVDNEASKLRAQYAFDSKHQPKQDSSSNDLRIKSDYQWKLFAMRDRFLDQGYGSSVLAMSHCSEIVLDSLKHFDGERYFLTDAVVMPNHLHFLAAFESEASMLKQCEAWKRFTARAINKLVGQIGEFWQPDQFDHLVRSVEQFEHFRKYIGNNPVVAHLKEGSYRHYSKKLDE